MATPPPLVAVRYAASAKCYPHQQGTLQTYYNHPARLLHKLPENVTLEQGSLVEPLSVALQGARRAGVTVGQSVLVLGGGAVGLLGCEISKALGATHVSVVDISPERVEFAEREGFANAGWVMPRKPRPETKEEGLKIAKETSTEILEWAGGDLAEGFDVVLECTGVESCMQSAIHVSDRQTAAGAAAAWWRRSRAPFG
jgi:L-iditol 2-dehydrogenase